MKNIEKKIEKIKDFLNDNKRFTFREDNLLVLNIKWSYYYDEDIIKDKLKKDGIKKELIEYINLEENFDHFFNMSVKDFFDYARELFYNKWYKNYKIYQTWRSGGYLYIDGLYQEIEDYLENLEYYLENKDITKKEAHEEIKEYLTLIEDIEEIFWILKKYIKDFEKNINIYFYTNIDFIKENILNDIEYKKSLL